MPLNLLNRAKRNALVLEKFYTETGITRTEEGSVARSLYDAIRSELEAIEDSTEDQIDNCNPLTASGPHLELWMEWFNFQRRLTEYAHARKEDAVVRVFPDKSVATFGDLNNNLPIVLKAGEFKAFGRSKIAGEVDFEEFEIEYELLEDAVLATNASEEFLSMVAIHPGARFNVPARQLVEHNFEDYATADSIQLKIENISPIINGVDEGNEEDSRFQLSKLGFLRPQSFPEKIQTTIDRLPGVSDVVMIDGFSGSGSIDYFIDTESFVVPSDLIETARETIEEVNTHGSLINVGPVERVGISIECGVKFKSNVTNEIKKSILNEMELQLFQEIVSVKRNDSLDLEDLYGRMSLGFAEVSSIGVTGKGFDSVFLYRSGIFGQRIGEALTDTLATIVLEETERLLPEGSIAKPFKIVESTR